MKYRTDIDGLRSIAVGAVVLYHFFPNLLSLGFFGVDIFFVISGYLITLQFIKMETRSFFSTMIDFYTRRIRRLLPVLFFVLCLTSIFFSYILLQADLEKFYSSLIASKTFWANWFFYRDGGYFGGDDQLKPLLHIWSLSVEEQFYIFFPTYFYFVILIGFAHL